MTENQTSKTQSAIVYQGWDEKTATAVKMTNKIENVKNSILSSIETNIKYYQDNKDNFKELKRYSDVINSPQGVYAFITAHGELFYLTETRCPFEPTDVVYVVDCHN